MASEIQDVAQAVRRLHLEVTDRLARIEEGQGYLHDELEAHTAQDDRNFESLRTQLSELAVANSVAEAVAKKTARRHAGVSGAAVSAFLLAVAELIRRQWLS